MTLDRMTVLPADITNDIHGLILLNRLFYGPMGLIPATAGNMSVKATDNMEDCEVFITRSGMFKELIAPEDFLRIGAEGQILAGQGKSSEETPIHLWLYRNDPENCFAVIHVHPPQVAALSAVAGDKITFSALELEKALTRSVIDVATHELLPLSLPVIDNSQDIGGEVIQSLESRREAILATRCVVNRNHGITCYGRTVLEAHRRVQAVTSLGETEAWLRLMQLGSRS